VGSNRRGAENKRGIAESWTENKGLKDKRQTKPTPGPRAGGNCSRKIGEMRRGEKHMGENRGSRGRNAEKVTVTSKQRLYPEGEGKVVSR